MKRMQTNNMDNRIIELVRLEENELYGTFGVLKINKMVYCVTLEPSDQENTANISSIPAQQYTCARVNSPTFGLTFEVLNVPSRTHVLFHAGNTITDTAGCILLAESYSKLDNQRSIKNSGDTFTYFNEYVMAGFDRFHLTIKEEY
jgi:hypothetical protein